MSNQASGFGGTIIKTEAGAKIESMIPVSERLLTIRSTLTCNSFSMSRVVALLVACFRFNADTHIGMRWSFKPQQREIKVQY